MGESYRTKQILSMSFRRKKVVVRTYSLFLSPTAIARAIHSCGSSRAAHDHSLTTGAESLRRPAVGESQPQQPSKQLKRAREREMSVPHADDLRSMIIA
jgi:hypothetical protein